MPKISPPTQGLMETHMAVLLFGFAGLFGKFLQLPSVSIVFGRTLFASIMLYVALVCFQQSLKVKQPADFWHFLFLGALLAIHWLTFFHAIQSSTVAIGLLTFSTFPVFITFMEPYVFNEKLRRFDVVTAGFIGIGLFLVVPSFQWNDRYTQGAFWGIVAGFTFAMLSLMNRKYVQNYPPLVIACYQNMVATLVLAPWVLWGDWNFTPRDLLLLAFLGVVCTAGAHVLFIRGLIQIKTQLASLIASLEPVYGIGFALLLLGEIPTGRTLMGGGIILGTTMVASMRIYNK